MRMRYIADDSEYVIGQEFDVDTILESNGRNISGSIIATIRSDEGETDIIRYNTMEQFLNDWDPIRDGAGHVLTEKPKEKIIFFPTKDDQ